MIRKTPGASAIAVLSARAGDRREFRDLLAGGHDAAEASADPLSRRDLHGGEQSAAAHRTSWTYPDYVALRDKNTVFSGLAASGSMGVIGMQLAESDASSPAELANGMPVSGNYFQVLGVEPALGRCSVPTRIARPEHSRMWC